LATNNYGIGVGGLGIEVGVAVGSLPVDQNPFTLLGSLTFV
jgi:hypothetical protein